MPADLAELDACRRIVDATVEAFGRIDVLVNNAAFQGKAESGAIDALDADRIERAFRVNILAMFHIVKQALPHMKEGSSIINVGSIQAYQPAAPILDYATTKGAIVTFTKGLAQYVIQKGVRANCVAPGPVWTPLIPSTMPQDSVATFGQHTAFERAAQPVELAPVYVFLASNESRFVTGEVYGATGGRTPY